MRMFITGASGFIGGHIAESLSHIHTVFAPTSSELNLLHDDSVERYIRRHNIDVVVHCAVNGGSGRSYYIKGMFYDNISMFFNIVRCRKYFKQLIYLGSGAVYDKRFPIVKAKENDIDKRIPSDEYGIYKYVCSKLIASASNMTDMRIFGIFGPGEDYRNRFISNAICRYIYHMPIVINQNVKFDYLYVGDFVKIIDYFVTQKPKYSAYNIGSGSTVTLIELAHIINTLDRHRVKIVVKNSYLNNEYTPDTRRLYREVSYKLLSPTEESLKTLFQWYKKHIHSIHQSEL